MNENPIHGPVVLVRCQIAENAGFVARSMKAFGAERLRLVQPSFSPDPRSACFKTASGASSILEQAEVYASLEEAVADCHRVVGFSRRTHQFSRPHLDLPSWAEQVQAEKDGRVALVFGPEDFGLSNEDKHLCETLVQIPLESETLSLNLAHAVTVVLYELSRSRTTARAAQTVSPKKEPLTQAETHRLFDLTVTVLEGTTFFKCGRRAYQAEILRHLLQRLDLTREEYPSAMGFIQSLRQLSGKNSPTPIFPGPDTDMSLEGGSSAGETAEPEGHVPANK